ncbi:MAG: restriction endonuclease subunit S [Chloroflexota bacterium]|nr:restriction endonuclease subunit S [Chloroflexota bacterium]
MSQLSDLIAGRSPAGVQFKSLDELGVLYGGLTGKTKADFAEGDARFVSYVNIFNNLSTNVTPEDRVTVAKAERQNRVRYGDVLFTGSSESADEVGMASGVTSEPPEPLYLNSFCFGFRPHNVDDLGPEFAKHLFRSLEVRKQIIRTSNGVTRINISKQRFRGIKIPVPPLAVQREIASILDKMESLNAELDAELDLRSRQCAFYRDSLLTFGESQSLGWAILGDVATFKYGYTASAAPIGKYRFIRITDITANGKLAPDNAKYVEATAAASEYLVKKGDLLMARTGATYGKTMLVEWNAAAVYASFLIRIRLDESRVLPGYYWHFAQSGHYWRQADGLVGIGGQPQFNANVLKAVQLPLPTLEEQERIVAILDKFEALVSDLSIGLPAEIAARRAQYEYYRDRLLTFDEAVA